VAFFPTVRTSPRGRCSVALRSWSGEVPGRIVKQDLMVRVGPEEHEEGFYLCGSPNAETFAIAAFSLSGDNPRASSNSSASPAADHAQLQR